MGLLLLQGASDLNPRELFASGEQGLWLDPSQMSTMFQDSNGVTPCTAAGDPVGLILDQSRGGLSQIGSELLTVADDSTFNSDTGFWTKSAGVTISGGQCVFTAVVSGAGVYRNNASFTTTGKWYQITFTIVSISAGAIRAYARNGVNGPLVSSAGTYTHFVLCGSSDNLTGLFTSGASTTAVIDNISVREVPGNHAYQTTSGARPTLARIPSSGRRNLLTRTEEFNDSGWLKQESSISQNTAVAPDGATTADTLIASTNSSNVHRTTQASIAVVNGQQYTLSVYAKSDGTYKALRLGVDSPLTLANFDLENGIASSGTITSVGNGWYRCSVAFTANATTATIRYSVWDTYAKAVADTAYTGTGTNGIFIWGAQLETGSSATNYQKVVATTDVTESGFNDLWHLVFDGSDDSLVTNAVDFSGTDEMTVIAGVRKLSDAATGMITELSASVGSNNGSFHLIGPNGANPNFLWRSKGTGEALALTSDSYAAPTSRVLSGIGDISADSCLLRINGTQVATGTEDQGTGNYGNHILYFGRRGGTTLPYNGHLYQLIIRGKTTPTGKLLEAERFVARRTGVSI